MFSFSENQEKQKNKMKIMIAVDSIQLGIIVILILCIVIGNASLVVSICTTNQLHNAPGYIVLSLAIADLLLGMWLLPFSIPAVISQQWKLGKS